jgi:small subunit ribosomal protein S8
MDVIGDFLTIIRNGIAVSRLSVTVPYSKLKNSIVDILKNEGFIKDFAIETEGTKKSLRIFLKYVDGESVIHEISRVSKPGRRMYRGFNDLRPVVGGLGVSILTTSHGVLTNKQAKARSVGGEVICTVW